MKKILAVVAAVIAAVALVFVGLTAPALASSTTIDKYGDVFTYNGNNSWTIQNTDNDQAIKDVGNTSNGELCSTYDTGKNIPCENGASYTFLGDTSRSGYDCAYVQIDGGNAGSQDTVPGDDSKSVCVPITTTSPTAAAAITTKAASCSSAETVAEGTITDATWTTDTVGSGSYTLVATANSGYTFPAGTGVSADGTTDTFTGTLDAELTSGCTTQPTCVSNPTVTYTYSHNAANDGIIVVTEKGVADGTALCAPFWVTATSWNYTNNASIWPQKINIVQKLEITTTGTTDYAAQVSCGQGDIYASTDSSAPSLNPGAYPKDTGELLGPNSPFAEHFLSDMGFTQVNSAGAPDGGGATYYNDANSCFVPTNETGTPVPSAATCTAPTGNGLTLPAVLGGQWTVSNDGYSKTYPADTAETITSVPNGYAAYTVTLSDASSSDGYSVTEQSWPWAPVDISTVDCNTKIQPASPTFADAVSCSDGSITIPTSAGVTYYIDGTQENAGIYYNLTGSHTVTATVDSGYEFTSGSYPADGWTQDLGSTSTCAITYQLSDTCTYDTDNGTSNQDVSLVFDNSKGTSSTTFEVNGTTYTVGVGDTLIQDVGPVTSDGTTFEVYVGGSTTPTDVVVAPFTTCIPVVAGDPSVVQQTCDAVTGSANTDGQISVALNPDLIYSISGPTGDISPVTTTLTDLPAGDYIVSVAAVTGYTVAGPIAWPLKLTVQPTACTIAPSDDAATCTSDPATRTEIDGDINVTLNPNIVYSVSGTGITGSEPLTAATTSFPDGVYTVTAALSPEAVTDGYQLVGDTSWGPYQFAALCVPVLPAWHAKASGTDATCTASGATEGYITLEHLASETGDVKYSIKNDATHKVTNVGATVTKVKEAPGSYTVTASPVNPKDGISTKTVFDVTIAAAAAGLCGGTLAFTGGGFVGYLGVTLALGMLFLGIAALWMRRRFGAHKTA